MTGPRLRHVLVLGTLALTLPANSCTPTAIVDLGWTLKSGEWMLANRAILREDPFTAAPHLAEQVDAQWLAQIAYQAVYALGGFEWLIMVTALCATAAYGLTLASAWRASGSVGLACGVTMLAYVLGFTNLGARAQTLAYPVFGLFLLAVFRLMRGPTRLVWLLPPAMVLWANLHGSWVLGLVLLGCGSVGAAVERRNWAAVKPWAVLLAACWLAALVTPFGVEGIGYLARVGSNQVIREATGEWLPTSVAGLQGVPFWLAVALLAAVALRSRLRLTMAEWLLLAAFGGLALTAGRNIVWFGMVLAPILARLATGLTRPRLFRPWGEFRESAVGNGVLAALILGLVAISLPWFKNVNPALEPRIRGMVRVETPTRLAAFLGSQELPGQMLNNVDWGGYLLWALPEQKRPWIDGRIELYPASTWDDYAAMTTPTSDWRSAMARHQIGYVALSMRQNAELIRVLRAQSDWREVYADDQSVVLVRSG